MPESVVTLAVAITEPDANAEAGSFLVAGEGALFGDALELALGRGFSRLAY